mgnify:CR=1 FL=1
MKPHGVVHFLKWSMPQATLIMAKPQEPPVAGPMGSRPNPASEKTSWSAAAIGRSAPVGSVPVVRGAPNVAEFAPSAESYVDATRFGSAEELAAYLLSMRDDIEVAAINDITPNETLAYLTRFDTRSVMPAGGNGMMMRIGLAG